MKILIVSNMYPCKKYPTFGTFVNNQCIQFEELGFEIKLSVLHKHVNIIAKMISYIIFYVRTFMLTLFMEKDLVYIHYPSYSAIPVLVANKIRRQKIYVNVHGTDVLPITKKQRKKEKNTGIAIKNSYRIVVPSEFFRCIVMNKYSVEEKKVVVYPSGGVNSNVFYPFDKNKIDYIKCKIGIDTKKTVIGFVGRLNNEKGWDFFLKLVNALRSRSEDIEFIAVGSGSDDKMFKEEVRKLELDKIIKKYPAQEQVVLSDFYNCIDVMIFPTRAKESLALVALEAMACGVILVASDIGALSYYIQNEVNGFKYPVDDIGTAKDIVRKYLGYTEERRKVISNNAQSTASAFSNSAAKEIIKGMFSDGDNQI